MSKKFKIFYIVILSFGIWNLVDLFFNWQEYGEKFRYIFYRIPVGLFLIFTLRTIELNQKSIQLFIRLVLVAIILLLLAPPGVYFEMFVI